MNEHTPTPWRATDMPGFASVAEFETGRLVAGCDASYRELIECKANAAFIVTACNNHAALVAALELAESALDNSLRSADTSTAGFIATRKLMARAHTTIRDSLAAVKEANKTAD